MTLIPPATLRWLNQHFSRITTSGNFVPEIDGLRFIAIAMVLLYHANWLLERKIPDFITASNDSWLFQWIISPVASVGNQGVQLFFVISGFILSQPFVKGPFGGGPAFSYKKYLLRRLTRLEPPYIVVCFAFLAGTYFLMEAPHEGSLLKHFLLSLSYTHNFWYPNTLPVINPVLWSLEIEVQFYLLCPLLGLGYFRYQNLGLRRLILAGIILIWALLSVSIPGLSFLNHGYYFLGGMLLCDLHHNTGLSRLCHSSLAAGLGFLLFGTIFTINYSNPGSALLRAALVSQLVVFCFLILNQPLLRRLITIMPLPLIGGMCYSIYMLHYGIMKLLAPRLFSMGSQLDFGVFFLIQLCLLCLVVLLCSAIFFKLLERPCMRKDWAQSLWLKLKWTHNSQGKKHEDG